MVKTPDDGLYMEDTVRRLAMRMKLHRLRGGVVHHCALLRRMLDLQGIKTELVKGFCVSPGDVCEHYWVRTVPSGLNLDIGYEVACLYTPELKDLQVMLLDSIPPELAGIEVKRQEDHARLFELYQTDPKTFWDETPVDVRRFK